MVIFGKISNFGTGILNCLLFQFVILLIFAVWSTSATSDSSSAETLVARDTAVLMHNRIAGVPPSAETLTAMTKLLEKGDAKGAALLATDSPSFYNLKLRSMFSAWSNVAGNPSVVLNDMIATLIGIVRDDVPFKEALYGDYLYTAHGDLIVEPEGRLDDDGQPIRRGNQSNWCKGGVFPSYEANSNEHYFCLQSRDLKTSLQQRRQSTTARGHWFKIIDDTREYETKEDGTREMVKGKVWWAAVPEGAISNEAIAGILSTRGFARAYFSAGTNRRATAFVLKYFLCHDMEKLHDVTIQDNFVRQDVSREPGGDHQLFKKRCVGCHAGMDALSGWSVYYDFGVDGVKFSDSGRYLGEQLIYRHGVVQTKITKNIVYDDGFDYKKEEHANDAFRNLWTKGQNSVLGWRGETSGNGARAWGMMITASKAFSSCMATHVYEQVCFAELESAEAKSARDALAMNFETDQYNMRKLFATTAVSCLTEDE